MVRYAINPHIIVDGIGMTISNELEDVSIFSNNILEKNKEIYDSLCTGIGYSEQKLLLEAKKIKETLTKEALNYIKNLIPVIWIDSIGKENVDIMFKVINKRVENICVLSQMIIQERGK